MKNMYLIKVLTLAMSFLLMPLLAVEQAEKEGADSTVGTSSIKENENTESEDFEPLNEIKLYLKDEDKIESIDSEEYILGLIKGADTAFRVAYETGAYGVYISGAGSTVMAIVDEKDDTFAERIEVELKKNGIFNWTVTELRTDSKGADIQFISDMEE